MQKTTKYRALSALLAATTMLILLATTALAYMPPEIVDAYHSTREDKSAADGDAWYFICPAPKAADQKNVKNMYGIAFNEIFIGDRNISYKDSEDIYLGKGVHFYNASIEKNAYSYFQYPVLYRGKVGFVIEGHGNGGGGGGPLDNVLSALRGKTSKKNPAMMILDGNYTVAAFKKDETLLVISGDPKVSGSKELKPLDAAAKKRILARRKAILASGDAVVEVSKRAALKRGGDAEELVWASVGQGMGPANEVYTELLKEYFLPRGWTFDSRDDGALLVWDLESPNMTKGPQLAEANAASAKAGLPGIKKMGENDKIVYISHTFRSKDGSADITLHYCLYVSAKTGKVKSKADVEVVGACIAALASQPNDNPDEPFAGDVELLIFDIDQSKESIEKAAVKAVKAMGK